MDPTPNCPLASLTQALAKHTPKLVPPGDTPQASVALILRPTDTDLELLFIERAAHPHDPWSGHIAFPGGRMEPIDPSIQATAERETHEEVGIRLQRAACLGRLNDLAGAVGAIHVAGFAYRLDQEPRLTLSSEVEHIFWVPLSKLADPHYRTDHRLTIRSNQRAFPALNLFGAGHPLLWGLTYRFVVQMAGFLGHHLPMET